MKLALVAIICAAIGATGGYAYGHSNASHGTGVYCYNPEPGVHLNGDPIKQVCVPTRR